MRAQATPPRPKWPFIVIGVVVAALVGYGLFAIASSQTGPIDPIPTSTASDLPTPTANLEPTGCLGGNARDVNMFLTAAEEAPHSTLGAVEFAAAYVRWMHQFPNPPATDAAAAATAFASSIDDFDLEEYLTSMPNLSGGVVEDGRDFYSSTVTGVWLVEDETDDSATVSIGTSFVIDGQLSATLRGSITVSVVWQNDGWKFESSEGTRTTEDLFSTGTRFSEGC